MRNKILKFLLNSLAVILVYKILISTKNNPTLWEKSNEMNFSDYNSVKDFNCSINRMIQVNDKIVSKLDELRSTLFFKIFKVNFDGECTFFKQNMICNFPSCSVCQCEDPEIPLPWKQEQREREELDTQITDKFNKWVDKYNALSPGKWIHDSEVDSKDGTYVNLLLNPEAYTGYQGQHIWSAIFRENCFSDRLDQICTEEKVFYKIFSGLLSNINIQISSNYYDHERNHSYVNITMFNERVANHKERVENLFFLYSILVKSFKKAENFLRNYEINTGNFTEDDKTRRLIDTILNSPEMKEIASSCNEHTEELNKFLNFNRMDQLMRQFRNITSIIDCVSCQKCKLHGKLQVYGIATMLKIIFDIKDGNFNLNRNEIISYVNFFGKVSKSISYMRRINENIKYSHFIYKFKFVFIILCSILILIYINFYFLSEKQENKKVTTKDTENIDGKVKTK